MVEPQSAFEGTRIPRHLAIIMDGNGRWARARGMARHFGHKAGVDTVKRIVRAAREAGIEYLTLYSFSTENWNRPREEVDELIKLLKLFIRRDLAELHHNNVRVRVIGDRQSLSGDLRSLLSEAEELTRNNTAHTLVIAFNYGARREIVTAARRLAKKAARGEIVAGDIGEDALVGELDTKDIPDPDLIVRTGGEVRLSNFLLWQAAYAELVFVDRRWPDFTEDDLHSAIAEYSSRKRRYGGLDLGRTAGGL